MGSSGFRVGTRGVLSPGLTTASPGAVGRQRPPLTPKSSTVPGTQGRKSRRNLNHVRGFEEAFGDPP
jgi:hypothetical protein